MDLEKKLNRLKKIISDMDSVLIAFSGGVDSTFLLKVASLALPNNKILAVTASSETYPKEELMFSQNIAQSLGIRHKVIQTYELENRRFTANPPNRCYFCKKELFSKLRDIARRFKLNFVIDASNVSDKQDFRPGSKAKEELRVHSPLQEAGLTKEDIRALSKELGLVTWDKPALACLASRIPYGKEITPFILTRIDKGEKFLREMGFGQVRLRHYNGLCRIEISQENMPRLFSKRHLIIRNLKKLGYSYVTIDLEGYRAGSMNESLRKAKIWKRYI